MRREFTLTDEQYYRLLDALDPFPWIILGGKAAIDPQEKGKLVWEQLGREMGFDPYTAKAGKNQRTFTAELLERESKTRRMGCPQCHAAMYRLSGVEIRMCPQCGILVDQRFDPPDIYTPDLIPWIRPLAEKAESEP